MIFNSYVKTDTYYEFLGSDGIKTLAPITSVILVDDSSGYLAIKLIATRKTIGLVNKNND